MAELDTAQRVWQKRLTVLQGDQDRVNKQHEGGRLTAREMPSLPAGILNNIKFSTETINLNAGDMVVMVSDGVLTGDERWLERLIKTWNEGSAQDLAQAVVQEAIRRRAETKDDDMTAVVVRLVDNS